MPSNQIPADVGVTGVGLVPLALNEPGADGAAASASRTGDLYRLSDPLLSEVGLEELLDTVLGRIREILDVDTVAILLKLPGAAELIARAAKGLEEEVAQKVRIPIGRGFAGRIAASRRPIFVPEVSEADVVNPILRQVGIRSLLGVPLIVEGELIGVLHVGSLTPREFTADDAELLALAAARVAPGIERARLFDELGRQQSVAESLQRGLLPDRLPTLPDVDVAARYVPAIDEVGGDWYDVVELRGGRVGIAIGDVVGHGVRAAALMAQLRAVLRAYALTERDPATVLTLLDNYVQHSHPMGLATVVYAVLDTEDGSLTVAVAGHPPLLLAGDGTAALLDVRGGPPIGAVPFPHYVAHTVHLARGDTAVLYTDGLVERRGETIDTGLERLRQAAVGELDPERLCSRLLDELVHGTRAPDDIALVAFRRPPLTPTLELRIPARASALSPVRRSLRAWLREHGGEPTVVDDIVLGAGEALANAVEHAYRSGDGDVRMRAELEDGTVSITVIDHGAWRPPRLETDRGRGLAIMRSTMDDVELTRDALGTRVVLRRILAAR